MVLQGHPVTQCMLPIPGPVLQLDCVPEQRWLLELLSVRWLLLQGEQSFPPCCRMKGSLESQEKRLSCSWLCL